jgi:preprotein translocase subunit SecG
MVPFITTIHVIVSIFLIIVVLLQSGKSADIAGAFGGVGSQTAFGPRGAASALSRATTAGIIIFMLTSGALSIMSSRHSGGGSVLDTVKGSSAPASTPAPAKNAPATPAPTPAQPKK